jgi:hypothetical protein
MSAWSGPTGSATSVLSARGTRTASPCPPSSSGPPHHPVEAGRLQSLFAELTGTVGPGKGSDDQFALLHRADVGLHSLHDADELVTHPVPGLGRESGVGNGLDADIVRAVRRASLWLSY